MLKGTKVTVSFTVGEGDVEKMDGNELAQQIADCMGSRDIYLENPECNFASMGYSCGDVNLGTCRVKK